MKRLFTSIILFIGIIAGGIIFASAMPDFVGTSIEFRVIISLILYGIAVLAVATYNK